MRGRIKAVHYYPTYSKFEIDIGEPVAFPVLLMTNRGLEVLDAE